MPHIGEKKEITMQDKPIPLVTGANKGIGLQIAKDLAAGGFTVLVRSRNLEHRETAATSVGAGDDDREQQRRDEVPSSVSRGDVCDRMAGQIDHDAGVGPLFDERESSAEQDHDLAEDFPDTEEHGEMNGISQVHDSRDGRRRAHDLQDPTEQE
jgi:NAD(P)-dependent dehydrogenase (short-subunit alcohol dehydrogenase family)